ncbi:MAG: CBS domain-containing protein, partial [Pseudomonadota bacterium]
MVTVTTSRVIKLPTCWFKSGAKRMSRLVMMPTNLPCSTASLAELKALKEQTGFSGIPVVEHGKLVGIITNRDMRFAPGL